MVEITEIIVSRSCRVNLGNYESLEHFVSMRARMEELDCDELVFAQLSAKVERAMVSQLQRSYKIRGKKDMTAENVARHHGLSHIPKKKE